MKMRKRILLLFCFYLQCNGHPQCLDFRAPFHAESTLTFCPDYQDFGCCTKRKDDELLFEYNRIKSQVSVSLWNKCGSYVKEFLCQKCSPYAAHIYDAETTLKPKNFPGLCNSYCRRFHSTCRDIIPYIANDDTELIQISQLGESAFCQHVQLIDVDYCYPDLKTNALLNNRINLVQVTKEGCLCVEKIADGLRNPVFARHAGDNSGRLFVGEVSGKIYVYYLNGTREREPFLNIKSATVNSNHRGDERGLLGLAFHPNFTSNGRLFIYYSTHAHQQGDHLIDDIDHKIRISEFTISPDNKNKADRASERVVIEVQEPFWNHNGGEILFGDDGFLYLFIGDGGAAGDPRGYSQNTSSLLGKVLRIDVNVDTTKYAYGIPSDNPFLRRRDFRPEIYAYGVRNIWRCGKDRGDPITGEGKGRILCGDVGQSAFEEIDILKKGVNYGWNLKEGYSCFKNDFCDNIPLEELPIHSYPHTVGKSITGGHFYRGCHSPNLNGYYIYGDYMNGKLFRLLENPVTKMWDSKEINMCGDDMCTPPLTNTYAVPHIMSFGEDEYGEIYMLSTSNASSAAPTGSMYRLVDPVRRGNPESCKSANNQPIVFQNVSGDKVFDGVNGRATTRRPGMSAFVVSVVVITLMIWV
ncbi:hypothetical protein FSP39_003137 [Pinctada imbricata]|uniref:HHIP-like protein 2 n=1 Tax=Pinctada imbricata TaxID=66713 RepID=A0AA88Y1Y2_PINIB|nr:hypothetical protein FSP39_003137 [Pinctada imbricata]